MREEKNASRVPVVSPVEEWQVPFFNGRLGRESPSPVRSLPGDGRHAGQACAAPGAVSVSGQ